MSSNFLTVTGIDNKKCTTIYIDKSNIEIIWGSGQDLENVKKGTTILIRFINRESRENLPEFDLTIVNPIGFITECTTKDDFSSLIEVNKSIIRSIHSRHSLSVVEIRFKSNNGPREKSFMISHNFIKFGEGNSSSGYYNFIFYNPHTGEEFPPKEKRITCSSPRFFVQNGLSIILYESDEYYNDILKLVKGNN